MTAPKHNKFGARPPGTHITGQGRLTLDLGTALKNRARDRATRSGQTLAAWCRAAVETALQEPAEPPMSVQINDALARARDGNITPSRIWLGRVEYDDLRAELDHLAKQPDAKTPQTFQGFPVTIMADKGGIVIT